jgi:putative spermidine/putrescine transport system permease protein
MASSLVLERWGSWRPGGLAAIFAVVTIPALPLIWKAVRAGDVAAILTSSFRNSLGNSAEIAIVVWAATLIVGLPAGILASTYSFPLRKLLLLLQIMPLLLPSHLLAIGWSSIAARLGFPGMLSGVFGCAIVFSTIGIPLVVCATFVSSASLTESQIEAARLAGGETAVFSQTMRHAFYPALAAAILAAILSLSDPGPGQIFGLSTAAAQILTSFAAFFDFTGAAWQCLILSGIALSIALPVLFLTTTPLADELLVKQTRPIRPQWRQFPSRLAVFLLLSLAAAELLFPFLGLVLPALSGASSNVRGMR